MLLDIAWNFRGGLCPGALAGPWVCVLKKFPV